MVFFHRCECLDRTFTLKEFNEYEDNHPNETVETVLECHGYRYTIYDICLNPRIIKKTFAKITIIVQTAQNIKGEWIGQTCVESSQFATVCGLHYEKKGFGSENEAIAHALLERANDWRCKKIRTRILKWRNEFRLIQLNLFEDEINI